MDTHINPPNYDSDDNDWDKELGSANDLTGHQDDVVIVVMGVTGAGKSLFIKHLTDDTSVKIGDGLDSKTSDVQILRFCDRENGRKVTVVNMPGFNDSRPKLSDTDILKWIANLLLEEYDQNRKLSGLIYVHRISDPRFNGQSSRNLRMFQELCGPVAYKNVVVLTTFWDQIPTHEVGVKREAQLKSKFFAKLVEGGAQFMRHDGTVESTRKVLRHILPMPPTITRIQTEIRKEGKSLMETAAGSVHSKEVEEAVANYKKGIADLTAEMATVKKSNKTPRQELETELVELRNSLAEREWEQAELKKGLGEGRDLRKRLDTNADMLRARLQPQIQSSTITTVMSPKHTKLNDIYVKAFSTLRMGLPIYEPSIDVHLGDIGFMDENDGLFHKLYNVAEPPVDIDSDGCPPPVNLVKGALQREHLDAIYLRLDTTKGSPCWVNVPVTSMGGTAEISLGYKFAQVQGRESILIPGKFIVKENLEELGVLKEYMNKYHKWIGREYATRRNFELKQLILVVGTVKTNSWAIAVTSKNEIDKNLAFTISSLTEGKEEWSKNLSVARCGPYMENNQENTTANQTLFIRRIALRSDIPLGKKGWFPSHVPRTFMQRLRATLDPDDS